jgi:hypothetical protein
MHVPIVLHNAPPATSAHHNSGSIHNHDHDPDYEDIGSLSDEERPVIHTATAVDLRQHKPSRRAPANQPPTGSHWSASTIASPASVRPPSASWFWGVEGEAEDVGGGVEVVVGVVVVAFLSFPPLLPISFLHRHSVFPPSSAKHLKHFSSVHPFVVLEKEKGERKGVLTADKPEERNRNRTWNRLRKRNKKRENDGTDHWKRERRRGRERRKVKRWRERWYTNKRESRKRGEKAEMSKDTMNDAV